MDIDLKNKKQTQKNQNNGRKYTIINNKIIIQGVLIKKDTGTNMSVLLNLTSIWINLGRYYLLEGYLLFPTVPRNVGFVMSVNENDHLKNRLTIWLSNKMLRLS